MSKKAAVRSPPDGDERQTTYEAERKHRHSETAHPGRGAKFFNPRNVSAYHACRVVRYMWGTSLPKAASGSFLVYNFLDTGTAIGRLRLDAGRQPLDPFRSLAHGRSLVANPIRIARTGSRPFCSGAVNEFVAAA